jgi:hypothetical protein
MAEASGDPAATLAGANPADLGTALKQIEILKKQIAKERQQRMDAQIREVALKATPGASISGLKPDDPDVGATLNQLGTDYDNLLYTVDNHTEIPEPVRTKLRVTLKDAAKMGLDRMRIQVTWLQNQLQESRNLAQTEAMSTVRASILSITQQLRSFSRQIRVPIKAAPSKAENGDTMMEVDNKEATNFKPGDTTTVSTSQWDTRNLVAADSLSLNELLGEFKVTAEPLIKYVARVSQLKAEREGRNAQNALSEAVLQLASVPKPSQHLQDLKDDSENVAHQIEECCKSGEERRLEIVRLRKLLRNAENAPGAPDRTRSDPNDEPFTRKEARALYKLLEDYINHSSQYQKIILLLEKLKKDAVHYVDDPAEPSAFQRAWFNLHVNRESQLEKLQKTCADEKQRLQGQVDTLKDQDTVHENLKAQITRPKATNEKLQEEKNRRVDPISLGKSITENSRLRVQIITLNTRIQDLERPKPQSGSS